MIVKPEKGSTKARFQKLKIERPINEGQIGVSTRFRGGMIRSFGSLGVGPKVFQCLLKHGDDQALRPGLVDTDTRHSGLTEVKATFLFVW